MCTYAFPLGRIPISSESANACVGVTGFDEAGNEVLDRIDSLVRHLRFCGVRPDKCSG